MGLEHAKIRFAHRRARELKQMKSLSGSISYFQQWSVVDEYQAPIYEVIFLLVYLPTFQQSEAEGSVLLDQV